MTGTLELSRVPVTGDTMKILCTFCGIELDDSVEVCPNCGEKHIKGSFGKVPKTMEELQRFISINDLSAGKMNFFVNFDYKHARAFGIYIDGSDYVVYENRDDSSRDEKYRGSSEAYAVYLVFKRIREELVPKPVEKTVQRKPKRRFLRFMFILTIFIAIRYIIAMLQ